MQVQDYHLQANLNFLSVYSISAKKSDGSMYFDGSMDYDESMDFLF